MFGFDVLGAGMLPVQVIFDNQGPHELEVIGHQSLSSQEPLLMDSCSSRGRLPLPRAFGFKSLKMTPEKCILSLSGSDAATATPAYTAGLFKGLPALPKRQPGNENGA